MKKQIIWRECTEDEKQERLNTLKVIKKRKSGWQPPLYVGTKMMTGNNKSRPGKKIRNSSEEHTFTYNAE